jgi:predicted dehydrogenase
MFQARTSSSFRTLKNLIDSGELGELRRMNWIITNWFRSAAYYASGGWRATWRGEGGGVLLNQLPHNLDMFQWLFGMPNKVTAFCGFGKYHDIEVEDSVTAYMEYPSGCTAVLVTSTGEAPGTDRLEIVADRGRVVVESGKISFDRTVQPVQEFSDTTIDAFPSLASWKCDIPTGSDGQSHQKVVDNFVDAVRTGTPLIAPGEEGVKSLELANAMLLSAWLGKTVDLPLDREQYVSELNARIASSRHEKKLVEAVAVDMASSFH